MADEQATPTGPDLTQGVALSDLVDGRLVGHVGDDEVLLVQVGSEFFAIGAHLQPLSSAARRWGGGRDNCAVSVAHACFDLRSGEAVRAPALSPVDC
jgi:apoptosis-inducing factor 3